MKEEIIIYFEKLHLSKNFGVGFYFFEKEEWLLPHVNF